MGEQEKMELTCLYCGKKAVEREVQTEGENKGRKYFKCGNPNKPECSKFFKWEEQLQVKVGEELSQPSLEDWGD